MISPREQCHLLTVGPDGPNADAWAGHNPERQTCTRLWIRVRTRYPGVGAAPVAQTTCWSRGERVHMCTIHTVSTHKQIPYIIIHERIHKNTFPTHTHMRITQTLVHTPPTNEPTQDTPTHTHAQKQICKHQYALRASKRMRQGNRNRTATRATQTE
jgi:hypothetical protein